MGRIEVLPQTLINQIAAGEVIVRPASVVKELVENAIDAGARRIAIQLREGGRSIAVIDDGCGMDRDDAELALQRHATSKIRTTDDLARIDTRGFRGEAVPSIASVARVEILTRPAEHLSGTRIRVEGGRIEEIASAGCPPGTRFSVQDLFYNTPARLKFLKSPTSEINAAMQIVTQQALSQPRVGWQVEVDGRKLIDVPPEQSLLDRVKALWGGVAEDGLFAVDTERRSITVQGILGIPRISRRDRRYQIFFVHRRPIVSRTLTSALEEAYRGLVMVHQHPIAALFIGIDHELVDVNVHPTKEEVRFRDERAVAGSLYRIVEEALRSTQLVPVMTLGGEPDHVDSLRPDLVRSESGAMGEHRPAGEASGDTARGPGAGDSRGIQPPDFFQSPLALAHPGALRKPQPPTSVARQTDWLGVAKPPREETDTEKSETGGGAGIAPETSLPADFTAFPDAAEGGSESCAGPPASSLTEPEMQAGSLWDRFGDPMPLGQIGNTYIAAAFGDGLLLVDQHAAHERLLFIELQHRPTVTYSQPLLVPMTVEIAPSDVPLMERVKPILLELGIEVDEFGGSTFVVRSVPGNFENLDVPGLIQDLLGSSLRDRERRAPEREWRERVLARMACRAAIKAGRRLSMPEMKRLLTDMRRVRMAFTCPHGRPTMIYLPRRELDRRFRRIV